MTDSVGRTASIGFRVGLWGNDVGSLADDLEKRDSDTTARTFVSSPDPMDVFSVDCLVVDCQDLPEPAIGIHEYVREIHATLPIVLITDGRPGEAIARRLRSDENAACIVRTEDGIPHALLSARCKRLAGRRLSGLEAESSSDNAYEFDYDDRRPLYRRRPIEFALLWGLAVLTYGFGDFLSTIAAVYLVSGLFEGNPVVDVVLRQFGISGFAVVKVLVFFLAVGISVRGGRVHDRVTYYAPPIAVAIVGAVLTAWNVALILAT